MARSQPPPDGWAQYRLDDLARRVSGHTPSQSKPEYWNGGIKWISLADSASLDKGLIDSTVKEISAEGVAHSSAVLHPAGTVVLSRDAGVGKSGVMASPMAVSQHFIGWICDGPNQLHNWFLYYWLQHNKKEFERMAVGSTIKTIGLPYFKRLLINCPSYDEQRRIAEVLRAWDRATEAIDRLVDSSEREERALAQKLLTRKAELTSGVEWPRRKARDLFRPVSKKGNGAEPLLAVTQDEGVVPRDLLERRVVMPSGETSGYKLVVPGNFVISLRSFQGGLEYSRYRGLVSPAYTVLEASAPIDDAFYRHYFKSHDFIGHLAVAVVGIRDGKQINYSDFSYLTFPYPPLEEQERIASILEGARRKTECLRREARSLRAQCRELIKLLLTGKRRVRLKGAA